MTKVYFSPSAERDLKKLPDETGKVFRRTHLLRFLENARVGKPLHGPLRGYFSYEFWAEGVLYRIAYEIIKGDVVILMIDTRDNFYKKFLRRARRWGFA